MPLALNLIGKKFGKLTAIKISHKKKDGIYWMCKCDCGKNVVAKGAQLTFGQRISCGCSRRETKMGEKNPMWKGNKVGYLGLHDWIERNLPKEKKCVLCNKERPYDLHNIDSKYTRELSKWIRICRKCHMNLDGRINNLKQFKK